MLLNSSPQYREMLAKSRAEKRLAREAGGEAFMPDDWSVAESTSTWGVVNVDSTDGADPTEELRVPSSKLPWAICKCSDQAEILWFNTCAGSVRERWLDDQLHPIVPGTVRCLTSDLRLRTEHRRVAGAMCQV